MADPHGAVVSRTQQLLEQQLQPWSGQLVSLGGQILAEARLTNDLAQHQEDHRLKNHLDHGPHCEANSPGFTIMYLVNVLRTCALPHCAMQCVEPAEPKHMFKYCTCMCIHLDTALHDV